MVWRLSWTHRRMIHILSRRVSWFFFRIFLSCEGESVVGRRPFLCRVWSSERTSIVVVHVCWQYKLLFGGVVNVRSLLQKNDFPCKSFKVCTATFCCNENVVLTDGNDSVSLMGNMHCIPAGFLLVGCVRVYFMSCRYFKTWSFTWRCSRMLDQLGPTLIAKLSAFVTLSSLLPLLCFENLCFAQGMPSLMLCTQGTPVFILDGRVFPGIRCCPASFL